MGYSEVLCHICGVSFNIGRIRTPSEPRSAAWSRWGPIISNVHVVDNSLHRGIYEDDSSHVTGERNSWVGECHRDAGCMFALRKIKDENRECIVSRRGRRKVGEKIEVDEEDETDGTWEEGGEGEEDEPLEYASDLDEDDHKEGSDVEMEDTDDDERTGAEQEELRRFWVQAMLKPRTAYHASAEVTSPAWYRDLLTVETPQKVQDDMFPLFYSNNLEATEYGTDGSADSDDDEGDHYLYGKMGYYPKQSNDVEHIAGPGCEHLCGYSGHEISIEEMRGCQTVQCLVRKPQGLHFEPLEDDEHFEKVGAFFLSGLSDHMPSRDYNSPIVRPWRHGCERPHAENTMWDESSFEEYAMPFHPSCFEVFKRASMLEHGTVDVDGLTSWWTKDAKNHMFSERSYGADVDKCSEQEWRHCKGTEYVVANPLYIPKLREILQDVVSADQNFTPRNGAFSIGESMTIDNSNDPFARLPAELQFEVLDNLTSKDIASLRLASRTFRQLPIYYFQKLLNREMPWLWEAWPTPTKSDHLPYSFWVTTTAREAQRKLQEPQKAIDALNDYVKIVSEEMPELKSVFEEMLPERIQAALGAHQSKVENDEDRKPFFLPPDRTDYYMLYMLITRHWKELRGLRNRKRIWEECKAISKMIKKMRKRGDIGPLRYATQ